MANTTLSGGGLGTITLHGSGSVIIENHAAKEALLTVLPLYLSDSDLTDVFDFGGTTKTINLTGIYLGANIAALKTFVDSVEAYIQGHQDTDAGYPLTFVDDMRGTIKVKIFSFNSTKLEGESTKVGWTMKLVQSSENA